MFSLELDPQVSQRYSNQHPPTVALLPWGNVLEDFLDTLGISLEVFCNEFKGSWIFGYVEALSRVGVRSVLICISTRVTTPSHFTHAPTGATICVLPAPRIYRALCRKMLNPYGRTVRQAFGNFHGRRRALLPLLAVLKEGVLYLTTPLRLVAREIRREGCKAILCQEYEYPRFDACVLLGRLMRLPVFATFQGGDYQRSRIERYLRPYALRASAGLIIGTQTESERVRALYGIPPGKLARIFNPVDLAIWSGVDRNDARDALGIPRGARVVVWHGRVSMQQKGLDVLLKAWERVCRRREGRDLRLLLVGTGKDAERVQQQIASMQLTGVFRVNEFVHDRTAIRRYLSAGDVYSFPSRHEGFPVSVIEAMACGLPVVAADANGVPDILEGAEASGGIVVPRDDPDKLALALGRVLDDPAWSTELGKRARRRVEAYFSLEAIGEQLRTFLFARQLEN
jgi:glycosyltransferase involved in cell wall biosynthesis